MTAWLAEYQRRSGLRSPIGHYLHALFGQAARFPGARILEVGTDIGDSTCALLAAAELTGGHVWSVDINPEAGFLAAYDAHREDGLWTFILGDSTAAAVLREVPPEVDVLFIDSSHLYPETCAELEHYIPRVRDGGVALFHDTNKPGTNDRVMEALNDKLPLLGQTWTEYPGECGLGLAYITR